MMGLRKSLLISILFVWVIPGHSQNGSYNYHRVHIQSSTITIHGKTNINQFQCSLNQPALNDSILVKNLWSNQKLEFKGLKLKYRVDDFECGMQAMNNDFQELLKAEEQPYLYLQLNSITLHPNNKAFHELNVDAQVEILLAGQRRTVDIKGAKVYNHSSAQMTLKGSKELLMTDFGIEPPTKMFGMIKVNNDIKIEFEISMVVSQYK